MNKLDSLNKSKAFHRAEIEKLDKEIMEECADVIDRYNDFKESPKKPKRSIAAIRSEMEQARNLMCSGMTMACIFNPFAAVQLSQASGLYEALKAELRKAEAERDKEKSRLQLEILNLQKELSQWL